MKIEELYEILSQEAKEFTYSLENSETGYEHYQGCMSLKKKEYFKTVKNILGDAAHIEGCKDWFASKKYCSKSDTHIAGPWTEKVKPLKTISELRPWQSALVTLLKEEPDDRTIIWYYDKDGGAGKTKICKYLAFNHGATVITNGGVKDIAFMVQDPKIVLFNFTRSKEAFVSYEGIESIKDGLITSCKYESGTKIFDSPHVVIFANFEPEFNKLTRDRWKLYKFNKNGDAILDNIDEDDDDM